MSGFSRFCRGCGLSVMIFTVSAGLVGCDLAKNQFTYDRPAELKRQDYRDGLAPAAAPEQAAAPVPDFQPVLSTPQELQLPSPLVTVSVNQTVSLRDLLFELAEQAEVDLEMDPQIHGSIIFTAKERPFNEVIDRICAMAGLRYKLKDSNVLRIELDRPYMKTYNVGFLNIARSGETSIQTKVSVGSDGDSSSGGGGEGGASTTTASSSSGSSSRIENKYAGDLWKELDEALEHLLTSTDTDVSLATLSDPVPMPVNPAPVPMSADPDAPPPLPGSPQVSAMPPAAAPTLNVTPASEPVVPNAPATYTISRQTGSVSVFASERQQKLVEKFLNDFRRRASAQVLIEAKVLQVDLTDEFSAGINWSDFDLTGIARVTDLSYPAPDFTTSTAQSVFSALIRPGNDVAAAIAALGRFGTVRALSSPRVTALNNQPAVVNVATSIVYFSLDNLASTVLNGNTTSTEGGLDTKAHAVPEGVLLNVIPSINPDTGEILLNIRPTITKVVSYATDPLPQLLDPSSNIIVQVPQMLTQEMESLIKLQSGQTMVLGGLMQDKNSVTEEGLPIISDLPIVGPLFKKHGDIAQKSELVIFLKATLVGGSNVDDTDRRIYEQFSLDRRPVKM